VDSRGEEAPEAEEVAVTEDGKKTATAPKGEIQEVGLADAPMINVGGGLRRSLTVPSRRVNEAKDGKRSVSSGKPRTKKVDRLAIAEKEGEEQSQMVKVAKAPTPPLDTGLPTPPSSKLLLNTTEEAESK
jgi:hypothetical protein